MPDAATEAQVGVELVRTLPPGRDEGRKPVVQVRSLAATPTSTPRLALPAAASTAGGDAPPCLAPPAAASADCEGAPHSAPGPPAGRAALATLSHLAHVVFSTAPAVLASAFAAPGFFAAPEDASASPDDVGGLLSSFLPEDAPPGMPAERPHPHPKAKHPKPNPCGMGARKRSAAACC